MKLLKGWRLIALIGIILLFLARVYFAFEKQENIEKQKNMIEELSRQQLQDRIDNPPEFEIISDSTMDNLEKQQAELDSIGRELEKNRKKFEEQMKKLNK